MLCVRPHTSEQPPSPPLSPTPFSHILVISLDLRFLQSGVSILHFSLSHFFFLGGPNCTEYGTLVLRLEMEAVHPAVESRVLLTTGPPGKSLNPLFHLSLPTEHTGGTDESRTSFLYVQWWLSLFNHPVTFDSL